MFRVEEVGKPGWLNTMVVVVATGPIDIQEQRLRHDNLHVVKVEEWRLHIDPGERFEVALPNGTCPHVGETLLLTHLLRDKPFKSRWQQLSSF